MFDEGGVMAKFTLIVGAVVGLALPIHLGAQQLPAKPTQVSQKDDKRICKSIVPTGSMLAKRFCLTKADLMKFNETTQSNADNMLRHRGTGMCDMTC